MAHQKQRDTLLSRPRARRNGVFFVGALVLPVFEPFRGKISPARLKHSRSEEPLTTWRPNTIAAVDRDRIVVPRSSIVEVSVVSNEVSFAILLSTD